MVKRVGKKQREKEIRGTGREPDNMNKRKGRNIPHSAVETQILEATMGH